MRVIFAGSSQFSVPSLESVRGAGHEVALVVTRPDKPRGRGQKVSATPVKHAAAALGLQVLEPLSINEPDAVALLRATDAELGIVVAYGELLGQDVLGVPPAGLINLHASLLPALRGAAPVNWAIIRGEKQTGVSVIRMAAKIDAGTILAQQDTPIGEQETAGELHDRLATMGADLLVDVVNRMARAERLPEIQQDPDRVSFAPRLSKKDGRIDWTLPAERIKNLVRGVTPWPGAHCVVESGGKSENVVLLRVDVRPAAPAAQDATPGTIVEADQHEGIAVRAGHGVVVIGELKPASGRAMGAADFLHGRELSPGDKFS